MTGDLYLVFEWWGTLFLVGTAAYPLTKVFFWRWWDRGYLFSKAVGMAIVTYLVYLFGTLHLLAFNTFAVAVSLGVVFVVGVVLESLCDKTPKFSLINLKTGLLFLFEELFFFAALLFWSWVKAYEPSIHGLEKFMDFGFTKSVLDTKFFPVSDMWYAGGTINYYYFGHIVMAVLTKFSGLDLRFTFNLMLATIFAFTGTMSFSIGYQLSDTGRQTSEKLKSDRWHLKSVIAGLLTAFLVTLAGNLQTIYAFTRGYTGDQVKPFWKLLWDIREIGGAGNLWGKLGEGMNTYWYANATRFIPFTIHEFPGYSFVVSDVHGHVLSLPFVLLAIVLLIDYFGFTDHLVKSQISNLKSQNQIQNSKFKVYSWIKLGFYGFLVAVLLMTNALDGPIYLGLFIVLWFIRRVSRQARDKLGVEKSQAGVLDGVYPEFFRRARTILPIGIVVIIALLTSLPFLLHFQSFVHGLAVNCPSALFANTKFGPLIFEGVEKCQHSPLWMLLILWGFFIYCGLWLIAPKIIENIRYSGLSLSRVFSREAGIRSFWNGSRVQPGMTNSIEGILAIFFIFSLLLIVFPEFFYFKDIYPMHFRSNTMFKLGYQAFIMFSIVSAYTIVKILFGWQSDIDSEVKSQKSKFVKFIFLVFLTPQLFLVSIYPIFSVRSYFDGLRTYRGLDGLVWFAQLYPDDYEAIVWLNKNAIRDMRNVTREEKCPSQNMSLDTCHISPPIIVEADGDSYTDYARFSAFTGLPTIVGWPVHEWLWRGGYEVVAPRREEVGKIYESQDLKITKQILAKYKVRYIIVGVLERQKYKSLAEWKFGKLGKIVFQSGTTVIYEISN